MRVEGWSQTVVHGNNREVPVILAIPWILRILRMGSKSAKSDGGLLKTRDWVSQVYFKPHLSPGPPRGPSYHHTRCLRVAGERIGAAQEGHGETPKRRAQGWQQSPQGSRGRLNYLV